MEMTKDKLAMQEAVAIRPIIEKYREAVETVAGHMTGAAALQESLYTAQDEMIDQLKKALSNSKSLRRADFDAIFTAILANRRRTREALPGLVDGYRANREAVIQEVQDLLGANLPDMANAWAALKERLLDSQSTGEREVIAALREIHMEQEELSAALSGLLSRAEKVKITDLKTVAKRLAGRDSRESAELAALLGMCETAGRNAGLKWRRLAG